MLKYSPAYGVSVTSVVSSSRAGGGRFVATEWGLEGGFAVTAERAVAEFEAAIG